MLPHKILDRKNTAIVYRTERTVLDLYFFFSSRRRHTILCVRLVGSAEMVELAEAKLHGEDVSLDALKRILRPWLRMKEPPDTVVLGCTHFPLLQEELLQVLPEGTRLVDSGAAIARRTAWLLEHEAPDAKSADANIAFCMAMTPEAEQLLPVLQRYGFETLEKLAVLG
ncbi:glutamate racemase [Salmonella enterica subsp. enterica serovar Tennessee]|nr:glutamate racemase [Salmonella enterica subsp. enterica serovar Tennessee]